MIAAIYTRTLTGRRILRALLCLLTFATSASAEGAWVLWQNTHIFFYANSSMGSWVDVVAAYPTYEEYQQRLRIQVHGAASDTIPSNSIIASSTAEAHGDSVTRKTYRRDGTVVETTSSWRCLPDGTDPRGPKGTK